MRQKSKETSCDSWMYILPSSKKQFLSFLGDEDNSFKPEDGNTGARKSALCVSPPLFMTSALPYDASVQNCYVLRCPWLCVCVCVCA